eukprot:maker-scaffold349_size200065-snap-gene-1.24 protein:Tk10544 transcript:maker-scaffold349_size200065-snap-gene-1.24-mRNA-1 annotation:"hypothetical protein"
MLTIREGLNLCCLALAMISKGPQIWHQFQRGSSQGIAFTTRFYTVLVVSGDLLLLLQYSVSVILNTMVLLVAIAYTPQTSLKRD